MTPSSSSSPQSKTLTLDSTTLFPQPTPPFPANFPPNKLIPKTKFIVDGFRFSGDHSVSYFLSHFHSDHYTGLNSTWSHGIIYCSPITARLVVQVLNISDSFVVALPMSKPVLIDGCEVTLIDANHCPGAVQFLYKVVTDNGNCYRYVHTGDFRYCDSMKSEPGLSEFIGADAVFLDTTYCNPKYVFPLQQESIDYVVNVINKYKDENGNDNEKVLFLVATYVIGKEKILLEVSRRCNRKIHVDERKLGILRTLGFGEDGVFTNEECESDVHVIGWNVLGETWPFFKPNFVKMKEVMEARGYSKVVGFVPTGWTYEVKRNKFAVRTKDSFEIHLVPYSEHSNYEELREYVKFLRPKRVIPTVGVDVENLDGKHVNKMLKHFSGLLDEMAIKQDFLMGFHRGPKENVQELKNQEHGSRDMVLITDKEMDEMIQELRDCLPDWVTRDQMMDIINKSGKNVVEAASYFYEHETEYHEQVVTSTPVSVSQESSIEIVKQVVAHASSTCTPVKTFSKSFASCSTAVKTILKSEVSPSSKRKNPSGTKQLSKKNISPSQKRKTSESKSSKKPKPTSQLEPGGPKQHTITKFFTKVSHTVEQPQNDEKVLPDIVTAHYKDEVDQFIQIINGSESVRGYATTILEETKGDINKALNLYYTKSKDEQSESNKSLDQSSCSVEDTKEPVKDKSWLKQSKESLAPQPPADNVASDLVSLPPEKYSPTDHGWS